MNALKFFVVVLFLSRFRSDLLCFIACDLSKDEELYLHLKM